MRAHSSKLNSSMKVGEKLEKLASCRQHPKSKNIVPPLKNLHTALMSTASDRLFSQNTQSFNNMQSNQTKLENTFQDKLNQIYPNIDLSIVQKINTTLDNMGTRFYFKRPSDHVGLGHSSIQKLRTSRDNSVTRNNISGFTALNNFNHPQQIGTYQVNTLANNTAIN